MNIGITASRGGLSPRIDLAVAAGLMLFTLCTTVGYQATFAYRPFDSTDASVAAKGEIEFELGPVGYLREGPEHFLVAPAMIGNLGIAENWEVVLQGRNFIDLEDSPPGARTQLVDTGLFLKGVLREGSLQDGHGPSLATEFGALLPTNHGEPGAGATWVAIVSQRWPAATLHLNAAATLTRAQRLDLFAGAILEAPYAWPVRPALEVFTEREFGTEWVVSGLAGIIWQVSDGLSFDVGLRLARTNEHDVNEVRAGLTWSFPLR
jgi:hypothetical protein